VTIIASITLARDGNVAGLAETVEGSGGRASRQTDQSSEEPRVSKYLSLFGFIAHFGDLVTNPFKRTFLRQKLGAGSARIPGALVIGLILCAVSVGTLATAVKSDMAKDQVAYSIAQLTPDGSDRAGKDYATVTGTLYEYYVDETTNGARKYTYYLLGGTNNVGGTAWIVVRSNRTDTDMEQLVSADGSVTLAGMLTSDRDGVYAAIHALGSDSPGSPDPSLVLREGEKPLPALPLYAIGLISGPLGLLLLLSWLMTLAVGYVVFKPAGSRNSLTAEPGTGFMPVRVTGLVSGYRNGRRTRELRAELRVPPTDPAAGPPPIELVWPNGKNSAAGIRLVPGTTRIVMGTAYPAGGARPAIKARFGGFDIILSFDTEQARDAAFDQLRSLADLVPSPDGASASVPS
jgi:hypothetical protein